MATFFTLTIELILGLKYPVIFPAVKLHSKQKSYIFQNYPDLGMRGWFRVFAS